MRHRFTAVARRLVACVVAVVAAVAAAAPAARAADAPRRPNIVLFIADDLSWSDCSIYGQKTGIRTPNMERVAAAGMTFTHAFVVSPSCAPSRAALLTGRAPARNGAMFNHQPPDAEWRRWPAYFKDLGYEVAAIGKTAHYAQVTSYGFDHASHFKYHEDDCVTAAVDWLKARKSDKPLCLIVGTNWPHVPWPAKSTYGPDEVPLPPTQVDTPRTRAFRARYAEAVSNADRDLGLVYDAARAALGDDLLFVYTADHGSQFPFGKWNCYDEGIRTPLIAVWPGKVKPGSRSGVLASWLDLLPTCVEVAGGKSPPAAGEAALDGASLVPVLRGDAAAAAESAVGQRKLIFTTHSGDGKMNAYPIRSVRTRDWKYIRNLSPEAEFHSHVDLAQGEDGQGYWASWAAKAKTDRAAAAVVARYHKRPAEELYDLAADPWELNNLAADPRHAQRLAELRAAVDAEMARQGDKGLETERARKPAAK